LVSDEQGVEHVWAKNLNLLNLLVETANVSIALRRSLVQLHDVDHGVRVVLEHADDGLGLVMQEDGAARLEQVLVHEAHDRDIELGAAGCWYDRVVVVDDLLHGADSHRTPAEVVDAGAVLLVLVLAVVLGPESLLVLDELLLHQHVVLDPLRLEQLQTAPCRGRHHRQLARLRRPPLLLTPDTSRNGRFPLLLLIFLLVLALILAACASLRRRTSGRCVTLEHTCQIIIAWRNDHDACAPYPIVCIANETAGSTQVRKRARSDAFKVKW
jgi:hypothetical protein